MRKQLMGTLAVLSLLVMSGLPLEAGHRRAGQRLTRGVPRVVASPQPAAKAESSRVSSTEFFDFPDVCPHYPLFQDGNGIWVWYAERHFGVGRNCENCDLEATVLTGNYDMESYNWPYPCGDEHCEPSVEFVKRAIEYSGRKGGRPVDFDYSPLSEIPAEVKAQETLPRDYFSFTDRSATPRVRYFIAYHIKTRRDQFTMAHEVDRAILDGKNVEIYPLDSAEVVPADRFGHAGTEHSFVYLHKPAGKYSDIVFFLKR